jgi:hypothetical protein
VSGCTVCGVVDSVYPLHQFKLAFSGMASDSSRASSTDVSIASPELAAKGTPDIPDSAYASAGSVQASALSRRGLTAAAVSSMISVRHPSRSYGLEHEAHFYRSPSLDTGTMGLGLSRRAPASTHRHSTDLGLYSEPKYGEPSSRPSGPDTSSALLSHRGSMGLGTGFLGVSLFGETRTTGRTGLESVRYETHLDCRTGISSTRQTSTSSDVYLVSTVQPTVLLPHVKIRARTSGSHHIGIQLIENNSIAIVTTLRSLGSRVIQSFHPQPHPPHANIQRRRAMVFSPNVLTHTGDSRP